MASWPNSGRRNYSKPRRFSEFNGAGDGDRTRDIKLGNSEAEFLTPFPAWVCAPLVPSKYALIWQVLAANGSEFDIKHSVMMSFSCLYSSPIAPNMALTRGGSVFATPSKRR